MNDSHTFLNSINWDDLKYFLHAAETGSLSAAAKQLHSNQPTVGRHIDNLEASLGVRLFQRHKKGLTLTQEGMWALEQSQQIGHSVQAIQRLATGAHDHLHGSVRLAVPEGLSNAVIIPGLASFYKRYPNLSLVLNVSPQAANLTLGEADIALRLFRPEEGDLVVRQLAEMALGLYASPAYLTQHGCPEAVADLKAHKVITYGDKLAALPENQWLLSASEPANRLVQSDSTSGRLHATRSGLGISIQPHLIARHEPGLSPILPDAQLGSYKVWLVYHQHLRHIPRINAVIEFLTGLFKA